jgi:hypothetical protein
MIRCGEPIALTAHFRPFATRGPTDGPELNPIECVGRDLQDGLASRQLLNVDAPQDESSQLLRASETPTRQSLTGDTYLMEAVNALRT